MYSRLWYFWAVYLEHPTTALKRIFETHESQMPWPGRAVPGCSRENQGPAAQGHYGYLGTNAANFRRPDP